MSDSQRLNKLVIRPARLHDLPEIVGMLADDEKGAQREQFQPDEPIRQCYKDAFEAIDVDTNNGLIVAELNGQIVGTFQLIYIPSISFQGGVRAQIESVRVENSARGRGIGSRMMEWAVEQAKQRGCRLVQLMTHCDRKNAHRFYERLGFVKSHVGMKVDLAP
jgi:GNAT superfamily N-acetyltransferase